MAVIDAISEAAIVRLNAIRLFRLGYVVRYLVEVVICHFDFPLEVQVRVR